MIGRILLSVVACAVAFIPVWVFLLVKYALSPEGFWQNLVLYGLGVYFLGVIQIFFLVFWVAALIFIWGEP